MKKIITAITTAVLAAASMTSMFSADAVWTFINEGTVDTLLGNGYTEVVDQNDPAFGLLENQYYPCRVFRNGFDYKFVEYYGSNAGCIEITSGEERFQEIYDAYKEQLGFSWDEYVNGTWNFSDNISDGTMPDENTVEKKLHLLKKMLAEAVADGVTFEPLSYRMLNGCVSKVKHDGIISFKDVTEEQLSKVKICCTDAYNAEYPLLDRSVDLVKKNGQNSDIYEIRVDAELAEKIMPILQKQFPDIAFSFKHIFDVMESGDKLTTSTVDLLALANSDFGDVNLDGKIDLTDTIMIKKYEAGAVTLAEEQKANADLDGNGAVDSNDALQLLRFLLRLEEAIG